MVCVPSQGMALSLSCPLPAKFRKKAGGKVDPQARMEDWKGAAMPERAHISPTNQQQPFTAILSLEACKQQGHANQFLMFWQATDQ
mmetsp:Transcript_22025/g.60989  ORF Transcript_22025/g.60989 Transcript_22025/m.60989 type:complete len:86 (-) Transcript_22025:2610-2867(-)